MTPRSVRAPWLIPALVMSACWYKDGSAPTTPGNALVAGASCNPADDAASPPLDPNEGGRMRSHVTGGLSADPRRRGGGGGRTWTGGEVPGFVPRTAGTLELFILDSADGGYLAFYREPYDLQSCKLGNEINCAYQARHYDARGTLRWSLDLNGLLSRRDHVEIQDIRLAGGVLYFNEACQSYSSEARGECSSLVAVDPAARKVLWRTAPLVSNGRFVVRGCYLVAGYGFTNEPDHLSLISRGSGQVLQKITVAAAPDRLTLEGKSQLDVRLYSGATGRFELVNIDGEGGKLRELDSDPAFGGDGYGGYGVGSSRYGGSRYGGSRYGGSRYGRPRYPRPRPRP